MSARCSLAGSCPTDVRRGLLGCARHWALVPARLQAQVVRTWDACGRSLQGAPRGTVVAYLEAVKAARRAVSAAERSPRFHDGREA